MTIEEKTWRLAGTIVTAIQRDIWLDLFLYGRYPWPVAERSSADPRHPKETIEP